MDAATFAGEHGCNQAEAEVVLAMLGPVLGAELFVRCTQAQDDYDRRVAIAGELLHRHEAGG